MWASPSVGLLGASSDQESLLLIGCVSDAEHVLGLFGPLLPLL